ncbi:MAG: thymidine phosphorylase [Bradymonadia bacterium]
MRIVELIRRKREGEPISPDDLRWIVESYTRDEVPDYQMSALLMAIFFKGMPPEELAPWTDAMLHSGMVLDLGDLPGFKVDKHSTGGVGDKISLPLAPLVAVCGATVPMIAGRGLAHTGGTLDKLESIPGFSVYRSVEQMKAQLSSLGAIIMGQTEEIAPADKRLYALRDVTGTIESIPLIASSIMSKKMAEGVDGLVLDVKVGQGAFMKSLDQARDLAHTMKAIGERLGKKVVALLTNMSQPLGVAVGNALEVRESIELLRGEGPADTRALTLALAEEMLTLAGLDPTEAVKALDDGRALARFREMIEAQGGDPRVCDDLDVLPSAPVVEPFLATQSGYVSAIDARAIGMGAMALGAGRSRKDQDVDPAVGVMMAARVGDEIQVGQPLLDTHRREGDWAEAKQWFERAFTFSDTPPKDEPLILDRI